MKYGKYTVLRRKIPFETTYFEKFPDRKDVIKILAVCENIRYFLVEDRYGVCKISSCNLLKGKLPSINTALNRTEYFKNKLKEYNTSYAQGLFEIIGEYISAHSKLIIKDKFGLLSCTPDRLLYLNSAPSIKSAVDSQQYWVNTVRDKYDNLYDYIDCEYTGSSQIVGVICKEHGVFYVERGSHQSGKRCNKCYMDENPPAIKESVNLELERWINEAKICKYFDYFKVYIIRCWNEDEEFFKVGRSYSLLSRRFHSKVSMPYNYEIVYQLKSENASKLYYLEREIIYQNRYNRYKPLKSFSGKNECFTYIDLEYIEELIKDFEIINI